MPENASFNGPVLKIFQGASPPPPSVVSIAPPSTNRQLRQWCNLLKRNVSVKMSVLQIDPRRTDEQSNLLKCYFVLIISDLSALMTLSKIGLACPSVLSDINLY